MLPRTASDDEHLRHGPNCTYLGDGKRGIFSRVNENLRSPVAVRVSRPFTSDEDFLTHEAHTLSKNGMVLIGAPSKPVGVVLRFEVVLANGSVLMRGEGRVVAFKENVLRDQAGLTLRFTRLDPKSKALVDRAALIREARAKGEPTPPPSAAAHMSDLPPASVPESIPPKSSARGAGVSMPPPLSKSPGVSKGPPPLPAAMTLEQKARADSVVPPAISESPEEADPFPAAGPDVSFAPPPIPSYPADAAIPDFADRSEQDEPTKAEPIRRESAIPAPVPVHAPSVDLGNVDATPFLEKLRARAKALSANDVNDIVAKKS